MVSIPLAATVLDRWFLDDEVRAVT